MEQTTQRQLIRARQIVADAHERPEPQRAGYVASVCGDDKDLLDLVKLLLEAGASGKSQIEDASGLEPAESGMDATDIDPAVTKFKPLNEVIGPYRLLEKLGEGGFGVVYAAEQEKPVKRRVALKVLKPGMDSKAVLSRFEAERQVLALLDHPNIARVLDAGETDRGLPYFVMDLVKGESIQAYCDRHCLGTEERLKLFVAVCHAVQHAHNKGIIHRDLKPSNIMVTLVDGQPMPRVIDFGIAKAAAGSLSELSLYTEQGVMIGTPSYMSPEQAEMTGLDIDERSDIYSLGVVLYQLLSGALPFDPATLREKGYAELLRVLREVEPPRPSDRVDSQEEDSTETARRRGTQPRTLTRQLKGELDWIVLKAIEKDRSRRYATASDFAGDVERYLRSEPVLAGPPSTLYRLRKLLVRKRAILTTAVVTLALVLGIALLTRLAPVPPSKGIREQSIAVMPFRADGADREQRFFVDGVTDEIQNLLARIDELRVIATTSTRSYVGVNYELVDVAETLNVAHLLLGSVRLIGDTVQVTAQLVDPRDERQLWGQSYERELKDLFTIQDEIAAEVVANLRVELLGPLPASRYVDPEVMALVAQAKQLAETRPEGVGENMYILLTRALEIDPDYVPALEWMTSANWFRVDGDQYPWDSMQLDNARINARIRQLDPTNATPDYYEAFMMESANQLEASASKYMRALSLDLRLIDNVRIAGYFARSNGKLDGATRLLEYALARDPLCHQCRMHYAITLLYAGDYERAQTEFERFQATGNGGWGEYVLTLLLQGKARKALAYVESIDADSEHLQVVLLSGRAMALHSLGRQNEAEAALAQLTAMRVYDQRSQKYSATRAAAWMGKNDLAFENLFAMAETRFQYLRKRTFSPVWRNLHDDPRWAEYRAISGMSAERLDAIEFDPVLPEN